MCNCGKRTFPSKTEAKQAARRTQSSSHHTYVKVGKIMAYRCPQRDGIWHIGHAAGTYRTRANAA